MDLGDEICDEVVKRLKLEDFKTFKIVTNEHEKIEKFIY